MVLAGHAGLAGVAFLLLWRSLAQGWVDGVSGDPIMVAAIRLCLPIASGIASAIAIGLGWNARRERAALIADAFSIGCVGGLLFVLTLGPAGRDVIGLLFIAAVALRFIPGVWLATDALVALPLLFVLTFGTYASLAAWHQAASLPLGDQVHYLLATDRLAHGSLDATIDPTLFRKLTTLDPTDADVATHVVSLPAGVRTVQGYAISLLLIPGWVAAGRFGAELV